MINIIAKKNKKMFIVLSVVVIVFLLIGCKTTNSSSPTSVATKQANTILKCVISKDAKTLESLFTPDVQNIPELNEQIEDFLNYIDGEIVSYSEPTGGRGTGEVRNGKTVYQELNGHIYDIKTDTGKSYEIIHHAIRINDNDPKEIGVYYIGIIDLDVYTLEAGYPDYGMTSIGIKIFNK